MADLIWQLHTYKWWLCFARKQPLSCLPRYHGERAGPSTSSKDWKCCTHREDSGAQDEEVRDSKVFGCCLKQLDRKWKLNSQSTDCIHVFCSLMSKTVNPNHQDELGYTPLHHAALSGHRYINYEGIFIITEFVTAFKLILLCHFLKWSIQIERSYFIRVLDRK